MFDDDLMMPRTYAESVGRIGRFLAFLRGLFVKSSVAAPPPLVGGYLVLEDGASKIVLEDSSGSLVLE